jgi:phosphatidate cytidylyltransferase
VPERKSGDLQRRILSAVVLVVPTLAATYWGGPYFAAVLFAFAVVMAWEWDRLCGGGTFRLSGGVLMLVVAAVASASAIGSYATALVAVLVGYLLALALGYVQGRPNPIWTALGAVYIGLPVVALVWLRGEDDAGRAMVLWLLAVVWATEIGAYGCGRLVGGPRLAPRISPKKTWAGAIGGVLAAALVSAAAASAAAVDAVGIVLFGVSLSIAAQAGDLLESAVKRRFGVKDMSNVIPGHGGVFDRVDGLLVAGPVAAGLIWASGGFQPWR